MIRLQQKYGVNCETDFEIKRLLAFAFALKCLQEFNLSRTLKSERKEAISILVSGKELLAVLPNAWGVVVVCRLQRIVYDQME